VCVCVCVCPCVSVFVEAVREQLAGIQCPSISVCDEGCNRAVVEGIAAERIRIGCNSQGGGMGG
jgi:hypothetical protein